MADRADLDFTYSLIDRIFRLSLGELADFSGAKYDGDFSLTLEQAQRRKHEYIAEQIGIEPGPPRARPRVRLGAAARLHPRAGRQRSRRHPVLGSGASCRRHGLDVRLSDARKVTGETFGAFDAVASLGAFEHFCSPDDYRAGRQETDLPRPVRGVAGVLPEGGRLYLQTMVFGRNMIPLGATGRHRRAAGLRRVVPGADGTPVPGLFFATRQGADRRAAPSRTSASLERQRPPRLHRDDPPMAAAVCASPACARRW